MFIPNSNKKKGWQTVCANEACDKDSTNHEHSHNNTTSPTTPSNLESGTSAEEKNDSNASANNTSTTGDHNHDHSHNHAEHSHSWDMHLVNDLIGHGADYLGFLNGLFSKFLYPELPQPWVKILLSAAMIPLSLAMARADTRNCAHETHNETNYADDLTLSRLEYAQLYTNAAIEFSQTAIRVFFLIQPLIINSVGHKATEPLIQYLINIPLAIAASYVAGSTAYCHYSVNWHNAMKNATETTEFLNDFAAVQGPNSHENPVAPYFKHTPDAWTVLALIGFLGNAFASQNTLAITFINSISLLADSSLELDFDTLSDLSSTDSLVLIVSMLIAAAISLAATYCNGVFNINGQYHQDHYALENPVVLSMPKKNALNALRATFATGFAATLLLPVITYLDPKDAAIPCIVLSVALTAFGAFGTSSDIATYDRHLQIWDDSFKQSTNPYTGLNDGASTALSIEQGQENSLTNPLLKNS